MISYLITNNTATLHINGEKSPRVLSFNKLDRSVLLEKIVSVNSAFKNNSSNKDELFNEFINFITPIKFAVTKHPDLFIGDNNKLYLRGYEHTPIQGYLSTKLLEFINEGLPLDYLINFCQKCFENPSSSAIEGLYWFLESNNYPITEDGNFIGYKRVTSYGNSAKPKKEFEGLKVDKQGNVRDSKGHFVGNPLRQEFIDYTNDNTEAQFVDSHTRTIKQSVGDIVSMPREDCDPEAGNTCSTGLNLWLA